MAATKAAGNGVMVSIIDPENRILKGTTFHLSSIASVRLNHRSGE